MPRLYLEKYPKKAKLSRYEQSNIVKIVLLSGCSQIVNSSKQVDMSSLSPAQRAFGVNIPAHKIISPYRVNPLGAHIDHQGGAVLAKTIDQRTELTFWPNEKKNEVSSPAQNVDSPSDSGALTIELLTGQSHWDPQRISFQPGDTSHTANWVRYAQAAAAAFQARYALTSGFRGFVDGSQIGAGLSSSASVVLAYLTALAYCNNIHISKVEMVELSRQVENDFMGLNNGIQDQMSIVFGQPSALTLLDVNAVTAENIDDADTIDDIKWVLCYSGFSRELVNSGFNTRVEECRKAAQGLDPSATVLGQVRMQRRNDRQLDSIQPELARRARHFFSEVERVKLGVNAWRAGQWQRFGTLMNESCHSSITQYESGSQPMIDLHEIASACSGVYGSRFCGGGYGGCVLMLTDAAASEQVQQTVLERYLKIYPEKQNIARVFVASADSTVRVE